MYKYSEYIPRYQVRKRHSEREKKKAHFIQSPRLKIKKIRPYHCYSSFSHKKDKYKILQFTRLKAKEITVKSDILLRKMKKQPI